MTKRFFSAPFIAFMICGTLIPACVIAYYGLTDRSGTFTMANIIAIASGEHAKALGLSLLLAFASTAICLLLAFPLGLALKDSKLGKKGFMVFVFILPMWMNFLLRTMAWQVLLEKNGIINGMLTAVGLPSLNIINTSAAVILGMVYDYLPFMILPIYNALIKIDNSLIEAAYDLGASKSLVLRKVIVPLSIPGIVSVENLTNKRFRLHFDTMDAISERVIEASVANGWHLQEINMEKSSLDVIFAKLSGKKIN